MRKILNQQLFKRFEESLTVNFKLLGGLHLNFPARLERPSTKDFCEYLASKCQLRKLRVWHCYDCSPFGPTCGGTSVQSFGSSQGM